MRRILSLTVLIGLVGLGVADAAQAAPTWLNPQNRQPAGTSGSFTTDAAMNPAGDAVGIWSGSDGANQRIYAAYRPRGGPYKSTVALSTASVNASSDEGAAIDDSGRAFVAWTEGTIVKLAVSSTAGTFGAAGPADTLSQAGASSPQVAVRPDGTAVIVWTRGGVVEYITRSAGGIYSPPAGAQPLSEGGAGSHHVATNASGDIAVVWLRANTIEARYRRAGQADFGPVETPGPAGTNVFYSGPKVAVDADGRATAVWQRSDDSATPRSIQSAGRTRSIPFGTGAPVNTPSTDSVSSPDVGVDDAGFVTTSWYRSAGSALRIEAATKPQGGSFGPTQPVSETSGSADFPEIKVNGPGDILVIWNRFVTGIGTRIIEAKVKPAGTSFEQNPVRIVSSEDDYSDFPDGALDAEGNGIAFYGRSLKPCCPPPITVHSAGLDSAPPRFTSLSAPAGGQAGQALGFSAATFDQWSSVSVSWSFGDGGTATGNSTSHKFGAGTFTVTATARDAVDNSVSTSRVVQVSSPPDGGGGGGGGGTPPPPPPTVLPSTVSSHWLAYRKYSKVDIFAVNDLPAAARVRIQCKTKRKKQQKRGCPYKSRSIATTFPRSRLAILKPFRKKKMPAGTRITITITAPGYIGKEFTYTTRKGKAPKRPRKRCIPPGGKPARCA